MTEDERQETWERLPRHIRATLKAVGPIGEAPPQGRDKVVDFILKTAFVAELWKREAEEQKKRADVLPPDTVTAALNLAADAIDQARQLAAKPRATATFERPPTRRFVDLSDQPNIGDVQAPSVASIRAELNPMKAVDGRGFPHLDLRKSAETHGGDDD